MEIWTSERHRTERECHMQKQKLNSHFNYIQQNPGQLVASGIIELFSVPSGVTSECPPSKSKLGKLGDFLKSSGNGLLPAMWEISKPLLLRWAMAEIGVVLQRIGKKQETDC